jgi:hypothetical protein
MARAVRGEGDGDDLASLAGDDQGAVAALGAHVLDVRAGRLGDPQPVQGQQRDQGVLAGRAEAGSDEKRAELVAVQGGGVRLVVQPGPPDVGRRRVAEQLLLHRVPVEARDGGQPAGDGGPGAAEGFQLAGECLNVGAAGGEQGQAPGAAPAGELAQVQGVGLAGQAAVAGQEPGEGEPLGLCERGLDGSDCGGRGRGHGGTSETAETLETPLGRPRPQRRTINSTVNRDRDLHHVTIRKYRSAVGGASCHLIPPIISRWSRDSRVVIGRAELPVMVVEMLAVPAAVVWTPVTVCVGGIGE